MLILALLSTVLFTTSSKGINDDEESSSLLRHGKGESNDTKASVGKSSYGSITITADGQGADLEYEAEQRKKDQEQMKGLEKRLEAEGSWVEYGPRPKQYSVSFSVPKHNSPYHRGACHQTLFPNYTMVIQLIFRQIRQILLHICTLSVALKGPHTPSKAPGGLCLPRVYSCT